MAPEEKRNPEEEIGDDPIPFFPDHLRTEAYVALGIIVLLVLVGLWGQLDPIGLEEPADPLNTPEHAKPEWYFLFLYQMLKYVPKTAGVLLPIIGMIVLVVWPFLDRRRADSRRAQQIRAVAVTVFLVLVTVLTILGASS